MTPTPPRPSGAPRHEAATRAFDELRPPERALLDDCVHCGFCLPTCPTYVLWGEEMDSPRGRILLMDLAEKGEIGLDATTVRHIDSCLGCMACVTACPSGVQYDRLIEATRAQIERRFVRSRTDRLRREAMFAVLPHHRRLRPLAAALVGYRASGLQRLLRRAGAVERLPRALRSAEGLAPTLGAGALHARAPAHTPPHGARRLRVALLLGCVQRAFFGDVNAATARVLAAHGCEVVAPPDQGCCGSLELHAGREESARSRARRLIDRLERVGADRVVVNAAGCGSNLKAYGKLLADDPAYAERARAFGARVADVSEVLAELGPPAGGLHPLPLRVAYHDACHLAHAQGVRAAPRQVLRAIPALELLEIPDAEICCGSAGVYNLLEPDAATDLGARKAASVARVAPDALAAANPGCLIQIAAHLRADGDTIPTFHPIELVEASLDARPVEDLVRERRRLLASAG